MFNRAIAEMLYGVYSPNGGVLGSMSVKNSLEIQ